MYRNDLPLNTVCIHEFDSNTQRIFVPLQIIVYSTQIIDSGTFVWNKIVFTQTWPAKTCSCNLWLHRKTHILCHVYISSFTLIHFSDSRPNLLCSCGSILVISACIKASYCGVLCVCCSFKFWKIYKHTENNDISQ